MKELQALVRELVLYAYAAENEKYMEGARLLERYMVSLGKEGLLPQSMHEHTLPQQADAGKRPDMVSARPQARHTNTTGFKGVAQTKGGRFRAFLWVRSDTYARGGHAKHLGVFDTAIEAAHAVDDAQARLQISGDYNFPERVSTP